MGFLEGRLESLMEEEREEGTSLSSSSDQGTSAVTGDGQVVPVGEEVNEDGGASPQESMRQDSPMLLMLGLIASMERDVEEAGLGGWYNGNLETTIGSRTLPDPVRVPDNLVHPAVLTSLMEGPVRPWQCLIWSESSPPPYSRALPDDHTSRLGGVLLQVGPSLIDIDGEYRGGGVVEEVEENESGDASVDL